LHPPVPALYSKQVPPQGDTINGIFVPGRTRIGYGSFGIQRNKSVFGEDAKFFRLERWLEATGPELQRMERMNDLVFGSGMYQWLARAWHILSYGNLFLLNSNRGAVPSATSIVAVAATMTSPTYRALRRLSWQWAGGLPRVILSI
jgi:hypothetical protein